MQLFNLQEFILHVTKDIHKLGGMKAKQKQF